MRPRPAIGLLATVAIWVAVTCGLWGWHELQRSRGSEIELRAVPVDPRDPLRGDFVILRYDISSFERGAGDDTAKAPLPRFGYDETVYVTLERRGGGWRIAAVADQPPAPVSHPDGTLFLRGKTGFAAGDRLEIRYGIERFYVPEGQGREYEQARNRERLWAIVKVTPQGRAYLERLEIR